MKLILRLFVAILLVSLSYVWGHYCADQSASHEKYEQSLSSLTVSILIFDTLTADSFSKVDPFIQSRILSEFESVANLRSEYGFNNSERVRCANSRRVRSFVKEGKLFGFDLSDVATEYLEKECLGTPSHKNWSTEEKTEPAS